MPHWLQGTIEELLRLQQALMTAEQDREELQQVKEQLQMIEEEVGRMIKEHGYNEYRRRTAGGAHPQSTDVETGCGPYSHSIVEYIE